MKNPTIEIVKSNFLYFEAFYPGHPDLILNNYDPENPGIYVASAFDNIIMSDDSRHIYIDIDFTMLPFGAILVRSEFEFEPNGEQWDELFTKEYVYPMVDLAFKECVLAFNEQYELSQKKKPDEIQVIDEIVPVISNEIIKNYNTVRKPHDIENAGIKKDFGLICKQSTGTIVTIQGTFLIIDELIYNNPLFNHSHNRRALSNYIHESKYNSLKTKCLEISDHPVILSYYESIFFYLCVDCAMQMLLGDKSDLLIDALEATGMNKEVRNFFFKSGTSLFDRLHESLSSTNSSIGNLEVDHKWNSIFQ